MSQITSPQYRKAFILVTTLFFMWGLSYGLIDVLNKHFQVTLNVSKAQSGLIQAAYFGAYFVVAIPAGLFMEWKGYKAGILCGLSLYAIGALLFVPAAGVAVGDCTATRHGTPGDLCPEAMMSPPAFTRWFFTPADVSTAETRSAMYPLAMPSSVMPIPERAKDRSAPET